MMACLFAGLHVVQGVCDSVLQHSKQATIQNELITVFWIGVAAGSALMGSMFAVGIVASRYLFRGKATKAKEQRGQAPAKNGGMKTHVDGTQSSNTESEGNGP